MVRQNTGSLTAARYSAASGQPGRRGDARPQGPSPSARRKHGCANVFDQARKGTLPGLVRTEATFADAAAEWLRCVEHDRDRKPSTVAGYRALVRSQLLPTFGGMKVESITTPMIETWFAGVDRAPSTRTKALVLLHGIFQRARKVYGLPSNPAADVGKPSVPRSGDIEVFSPEESWRSCEQPKPTRTRPSS